MAATEPVVTEIIITAQQAEVTLDRIEAAYTHLGDRAEAAQARATAAWERQMQSLTKLPQSIESVARSYDRIRGSLDPVVAAQQRAENEMTRSLATINRAVLLNVTTEEQAAKDIAALRQKQINDINRVKEAQLRGAAANQNMRMGGQRFAALNVSNQLQDIGITAAMGQSIGTIALQQGTQVGAGLQMALGDKGAAGAVKILGTAFTSLLNPVMLASVALVGLIAAGIKLVNWSHTAISVLNLVKDVLPKIADYAAIAAAGFALLYAPAILGGIRALSEVVLGLTARLAGLAIGFALANPGTAFIIGITAAVAALSIFRDDLTKAFGVDIVGAVKTGANYIINSFRAAFSDVQFVWKSLPDIMAVAMTGAVNWVLDGVKRMVNAGIEGVNSLITGVNNIAAKIGADKAAQFFGFSGKIKTIDPWGGIDPMSDGGVADRLSKANTSHADDIRAIMSTDTLGQFGTAIAKGADYATGKINDLIQAINTAKTDASKHRGKTDAERMAERYDKITQSGQNFIAMQEAERKSLGLTDLQAAQLTRTQQLLNRARQAGIDLTPQQIADLTNLGKAMGAAEIATKKMREAYDFVRSGVRNVFLSFSSAIEQGKSVWKAFGDAAKSVLDSIINRINDQLATAITNALFKNGGGQTGLFGSLLNFLGFGGGGAFPAAPAGSIVSGMSLADWGFANGTAGAPPGWAWVGERGPELMRFRGGEQVMSHPVSMRVSRGFANGTAANDRAANQNSLVQIDVAVHVNDDGTLGVIARQAGGQAADVRIQQYDRGLPDRVKQINDDPRAR